MAEGCHSTYDLVTSLGYIHFMGYSIFVHQPFGLAIVLGGCLHAEVVYVCTEVHVWKLTLAV